MGIPFTAWHLKSCTHQAHGTDGKWSCRSLISFSIRDCPHIMHEKQSLRAEQKPGQVSAENLLQLYKAKLHIINQQ